MRTVTVPASTHDRVETLRIEALHTTNGIIAVLGMPIALWAAWFLWPESPARALAAVIGGVLDRRSSGAPVARAHVSEVEPGRGLDMGVSLFLAGQRRVRHDRSFDVDHGDRDRHRHGPPGRDRRRGRILRRAPVGAADRVRLVVANLSEHSASRGSHPFLARLRHHERNHRGRRLGCHRPARAQPRSGHANWFSTFGASSGRVRRST